MTEKITLELPLEMARRARALAAEAHQPIESLLVQWVGQAVADPPLDHLADNQILSLCDLEMESQEQNELSELLARNREGKLDAAGQVRLDLLMEQYRRAMVRKAHAWKIAVARGLRPPLN